MARKTPKVYMQVHFPAGIKDNPLGFQEVPLPICAGAVAFTDPAIRIDDAVPGNIIRQG